MTARDSGDNMPVGFLSNGSSKQRKAFSKVCHAVAALPAIVEMFQFHRCRNPDDTP